jgi:stage II sporulation protein M
MKKVEESTERFLERNYRKAFSFLKSSRKYIYGVMILFLVFFLIGFFVSLPEEFSSMILEYLRELVQKTEGFGFFEMFAFIFLNNSLVGFFSIVFGVLFGVFPILSIISNGFILGYVSNMSVFVSGFSSLWRLLPHGIFELPAIFISFGLGIKLGSFIFYKNALEKFKEYFLESFRVFVFIVLPLLFISGIIESLLIVFVG